MDWKTVESVTIVNRDGESENYKIQHDGNFYRIQNDFGNISFEFDVSSGFELSDKLQGIIAADIQKEINKFLNEQDAITDAKNSKATQMKLFGSTKNIKNKLNQKTKDAK